LSITSEWNAKQKRLKEIIRNAEMFDEAKELFISMHRSVHFAQANRSEEPTIIDKLWDDVRRNEFAIMPTEKDVTIAWNIWHITRIEDLTTNLLVNSSEQVLNEEWLARLHTKVTDTGNAMTTDEIMDFSKNIMTDELKNYRMAVGNQTRKILHDLKFEDMKRKFDGDQVDRILRVGGVLEHSKSIWLLDFWGKKDVAGIILMPITRHQIVHLNNGYNLKQAIRKKKEFYRA